MHLGLYLFKNRILCNAGIIDGQCRCQQKDTGKRNGYPVDTPRFYDEQSDADNIEPAVKRSEIEPVDGDAVIVEPAYDDEMGLTLDSIRISRKKERTEYERKQNDEDGWKEKLVCLPVKQVQVSQL